MEAGNSPLITSFHRCPLAVGYGLAVSSWEEEDGDGVEDDALANGSSGVVQRCTGVDLVETELWRPALASAAIGSVVTTRINWISSKSASRSSNVELGVCQQGQRVEWRRCCLENDDLILVVIR